MNRRRAYWIATGLLCLLFTGGGFAHLTRAESIAADMAHLGYPAYVMTILGVAKLLGVAALLTPRWPLLREWAYAGFTIDLLGATASHAFNGDAITTTARPVAVLALCASSYFLRPDSLRPAAPTAALRAPLEETS